jgi:RHS repeat-associated protein
MPKLDPRHVVRIPSPTTSEVVVTTPSIPGLELHLPPGTVVRGEDGEVVTEISITPIPVDRPPFPLPGFRVPVYFTIQPGGAYVWTSGRGPKGAWLVYPNYRDGVPGQRVQFYHYDPDERGWYAYGLGTVTDDATQVAPDPTTRLYAFTGAMINCCNVSPPPDGATPGGPSKADPVDPSTGLFLMHQTDLYLPDVLPLALTRTYESGDNLARPFGRGMTHPYAMFLWSAQQYQEADLILPEGGKIHYVRTSSGTGPFDAVFEHTATPTAFYQSTLAWNGNGWDLALTDGTVYVFGNEAPLQSIRDRYGNQITLTWSDTNLAGCGTGNILRVTSPHGRWLAFTYDANDRITEVADNLGRTVDYTYDANGNLETVTDPEGSVTTYTWDGSNRLASIEDGRGIVYLTNEYDANGRVDAQTLADPNASYALAYTTDGGGAITQTQVTDPRGHVERLAFNADHYVTSRTEAYGTALERTTTTERESGTNLVTATVDPLSRRTEYTYDSAGRVLTETRLADTQTPLTTTYTYEPVFGQLATITDPRDHTWTLTYDRHGRLTGAEDPLSHATAVTMNAVGQVTAVSDPLQHAWAFGYTGGDLTAVTDPLSRAQSRFVDGGGRLIAATDGLGRVTRTTYDHLNRPTMVTDPLGGQTAFSYDENSNLLGLTDANAHTTDYTYDDNDRVGSRTDPLTHATSYDYDLNGNLTQVINRESQVTAYTYDELDRLSEVTFDDASTITYTYDAGDRLTEIDDSANGTITRTYDDLDRLTEEVTPEGTVDYTYDDDGLRTTMTVDEQTIVEYAYDDAHRLTSITQGTDVVSFTYDDANRRSTLTYPNGIVTTYGYDDANELTSLTYTLGETTLGDLTYTYDAAGQRTSVGGSFARTGLPAALTSATYDAANRIDSWDSASFTYDLNGNLTDDGTNTYTWNARGQLAGLSGGVSASFAYDGVGRRRGKTIGGSTTNFVYDGLNFVQEQASGGTATANLLTGLGIDETFVRTDANGASTLLTDALGSTLELADGSGTLQTHYMYEPFGGTSSTGTVSTSAQQFTRRENDAAGLYFYRARFYSPGVQRFISEDPVGFAAGPNIYAYVQGAPTAFVDPLGLDKRGTFQLGLGGAACGGLGCISVGIGIAFDANGGIGFYGGGGAGPGFGAGASAGVQIGFSNARGVTGLRGPFIQTGGGGGTGAGGSVDYWGGQSGSDFVAGGTTTVGAGAGASASAEVTWTNVLEVW